MIYDLRFLPEVEDDGLGGYSWYEEKAYGIGEEFLRMFYACANDLTHDSYRTFTGKCIEYRIQHR